MPFISTIFIRWSMVQLAIASTIGLILIVAKAYGEFSWWWQFRSLHTEGMWLGWIINLVFGTAWWIMPKRLDFPDKYGFVSFAWLSFVFMQIDWLYRVFIDPVTAPMFIRLTPLVAVICFVIGIWPRLKHIIHVHETK